VRLCTPRLPQEQPLTHYLRKKFLSHNKFVSADLTASFCIFLLLPRRLSPISSALALPPACSHRLIRSPGQKNWDAITYCSDSCRKNKIRPNSLDTTFESKILALLAHRRTIHGLAASITCEKAEQEALDNNKNVKPDEEDPETVRESPGDTRIDSQPTRTRERCRQAARRLAARGEILITQNGKVVDPSFAKGVMELKLPS
jgi:hypothetical protein